MTEHEPTPGTTPDFATDHGTSANGAGAATAEASAGAMLRQMREAAGVHAAVLASVLKVPQQKLEALESDRLDALPDVTFARGLAAAICRAFGVDSAPVLARMPMAGNRLRTQESDLNQSFRSAGDRPRSMLASGPSRPLMIVVGLLLVGAALLWLLPTLPIQLSAPSPTVNSDGSVSESVTPGPPVEAVEPTAPPAAAGSAAAAEQPLAAASAGQGPTGAPSAPASAAEAADQIIVITASAETWVTVRDAAGKPVINRALAAGETVSATGAVPLGVTIGRKDAVTVKVRGKPFDLKSISRSNVARFQVQ